MFLLHVTVTSHFRLKLYQDVSIVEYVANDLLALYIYKTVNCAENWVIYEPGNGGIF